MSHSSRSWHHPCGREAKCKENHSCKTFSPYLNIIKREGSKPWPRRRRRRRRCRSNVASASLVWGRALASYFARHLSLNDSGRTQTRPLLFFTALTGLSGHAAADEKLVVAQHCRRGSAQRAGVDPPDLILFAARRLALLSYPLSPIAARGSTSGPRSRSTGNCDASPFSWPEHGAVPKTRQSRRRTSKRACLPTLQL
jgi:hypothetical protein